MKVVAGILGVLVIVGLLIAMPLVTRRLARSPDCGSHVVMVRGPLGEPIECVCIDGALATCFNPGP